MILLCIHFRCEEINLCIVLSLSFAHALSLALTLDIGDSLMLLDDTRLASVVPYDTVLCFFDATHCALLLLFALCFSQAFSLGLVVRYAQINLYDATMMPLE